MAELWNFITETKNENEIDDKEPEQNTCGGLSVSKFFCNKKNQGDNQQYSFYTPYVVPLGLVYFPDEESQETDRDQEYQPKSVCEAFDKLFFMTAKELGKPKNTKTRKKIPR